MPDPWPTMAIEEQFSALVTPEPDYPSTLLYLESNREMVAPSSRGVLDHEVSQLTDALLEGTYARALTKRVWGEEAKVLEYKGELLPNPEEILTLVVTQSEIYPG